MMHRDTRDLLFAVIAALLVTTLAWLWGRAEPWKRVLLARAWLWNTLHKKQLEEITELRKDVDALLSVLDHWVTPGAGDKQRQFEYMAEVLNARGKRGISGTDMRVARLIDTNGTPPDGRVLAGQTPGAGRGHAPAVGTRQYPHAVNQMSDAAGRRRY